MTDGGQNKSGLTIVCDNANIQAEQSATIKTQSATIDSPKTHRKGNVKVDGDVKADRDVKAGSVSLKTHTHSNGDMGSPTGAPMDQVSLFSPFLNRRRIF